MPRSGWVDGEAPSASRRRRSRCGGCGPSLPRSVVRVGSLRRVAIWSPAPAWVPSAERHRVVRSRRRGWPGCSVDPPGGVGGGGGDGDGPAGVGVAVVEVGDPVGRRGRGGRCGGGRGRRRRRRPCGSPARRARLASASQGSVKRRGVSRSWCGSGVAPVGEHAAAADGGELGGVADERRAASGVGRARSTSSARSSVAAMPASSTMTVVPAGHGDRSCRGGG